MDKIFYVNFISIILGISVVLLIYNFTPINNNIIYIRN